MDTAGDDLFDHFEWNLLGDVVFDDGLALWEAFSAALAAFPDRPRAEQAQLAEQALRDLYRDGLIYLFRMEGQALDPSAVPEHLPPSEVQRVLASPGWRRDPVDPEIVTIWIGATQKGREACADPPPEIRRLWQLPTQ